MKTKRQFFNLLLAVVLCVGLLPTIAFAAERTTSATATSRTYNGTTIVDVTDMYFAAAVNDEDYARLSATAIGQLPSPNAGHYTTLSGLTNLQLKERDPSLYPDDVVDWSVWYSIDEQSFASATVPTDVTIEKAEPHLSIAAAETSVEGGEEIHITVTLENDYSYEAGLPTAEQIIITPTNAVRKDGTVLERNGNQYTAVFVSSNDTSASKAEFSVNVSEDATNYKPLTEPVSTSVEIYFSASGKEEIFRPSETTKPTDTPERPQTDTDKPDKTIPDTGAESNFSLWFSLLGLSGAGLIGTAVYGRKKMRKADTTR